MDHTGLDRLLERTDRSEVSCPASGAKYGRLEPRRSDEPARAVQGSGGEVCYFLFFLKKSDRITVGASTHRYYLSENDETAP